MPLRVEKTGIDYSVVTASLKFGFLLTEQSDFRKPLKINIFSGNLDKRSRIILKVTGGDNLSGSHRAGYHENHWEAVVPVQPKSCCIFTPIGILSVLKP